MSQVVAVTGASGYLGARLVDFFEARGWDTIRMVRRPALASDRSFTLGSRLDPSCLSGVSVLIHTAYDMKVTEEADIWSVNVRGTELLLDAAGAAGVDKTIVLSSMSAYEGTTQMYGRAKLSIERAARDHGAIAVRPGLVMGPKAGGMAGALTRLTRLPLVPVVTGVGDQFPIDEQAFIEAMYRLADPELDPGFLEEPIGLASPVAIDFPEILRRLAGYEGRELGPIVPVPWRLLYQGLRLGERLRIPLPFRADSLLGLARPAQLVPGQDAATRLGLNLELV